MKEIGGQFSIWDSFFTLNSQIDLTKCYTFHCGRAAIEAITGNLSPGTVLLPSYICESVAKPFLNAPHLKVQWVSLQLPQSFDLKNLKTMVDIYNPKYLFLLDFFGYIDSNLEDILQLCEAKKIDIIYDATHSWLNHIPFSPPLWATYCVVSVRKTIPVFDGGLLWSKKPLSNIYTSRICHYKSFIRLFAMFLKKISYLKKIWLPILQWYEESLDSSFGQRTPMSWISKFMLQKQNLIKISRCRAANWKFLMENMPSTIRFICASPITFGFPILFKNEREREMMKRRFISSCVYCPIHWPIRFYLQDSSYPTSLCLLTLPIDQRFTVKDMEKVISLLRQIK